MINGYMYRDMVISAANAIENKREEINNLNIFPVPDGDTGTNMSLTMGAGRTSISGFSGNLSECSEKVAGALLRGGRGNSGVILSLFFRGVAKEFKGNASADKVLFARALKSGVDSAYRAVKQPTEGTILTVMRLSAETAMNLSADMNLPFAEFFDGILSAAQETLARTPEILPVLKQANVVDAGGKGFVTILEGMKSVLDGKGIVRAEAPQETAQKADFKMFETGDIRFSYCTECIIDKKKDGTVTEKEILRFHDFIMNAGDSGVFIDDEDFIKFHVHTNDPGKVLSACLEFGELTMVKIENMRLQHTSLSLANGGSAEEKPEAEDTVAEPVKKYGFVSVVAGDGVTEVFRDLGVDYFVKGGQTMNPSTDDLLCAINSTPSEIVFVLPNNKNIYMAAKQAEALVSGKKVVVIKSYSIPQGIGAMIAFNEDLDLKDNVLTMTEAIKNVHTLRMTFAARDSVFQNSSIKEGQMLGLVEGDVKVVRDSQEDCMAGLADEMKGCSCITLFYGEGVTEDQANKMSDIIRDKVGEDTEIMVVNGGQPVYYYVISAE